MSGELAPLALCLAGSLSPEVALARLLLDGDTPDAVAAHVAACRDDANPRWRALAALLEARRDGLRSLATMLRAAAVDHTPGDVPPEAAVARIATLFDRAVAVAPAASVAAYSLDDPGILAAATEELVAWLLRESLAGAAASVLDLGCGIGRVAAALAPRCAAVLGIDVSAGMVEEARRRHPGPANLRFARTDGLGLDFPQGSFDLVLAVDSFPYLVQAGGGLAQRHVAGAAALLRPGGALAILNCSYRGDVPADVADLAAWGATCGLALTRCGERPFRLWDAAAFVLRQA